MQDEAIERIERREEIYNNKIAEAELAVRRVAEATKEFQSLKGQVQRQRTAIQNLSSKKEDLEKAIDKIQISIAGNSFKFKDL